jgi:hypothetical protein
MASQLFDPNDALVEIHRHDQPVRIALDIEDNPIRRADTGGGAGLLDVRKGMPKCCGR